jgi:hypothetical protein
MNATTVRAAPQCQPFTGADPGAQRAEQHAAAQRAEQHAAGRNARVATVPV